MPKSVLAYTYLPSPIGPLLLAGDGTALHFLSFSTGSKAFGHQSHWIEDRAPLAEPIRQLNAYFAGEIKQFDLILQPTGTDFQCQVWRKLADIPFGETRTYGWLAKQLGRPTASRAVGAANGANPIPIILPCHRVIGSTGALTGFGGGIETKRFLLSHEGLRVDPDRDRCDLQLSLL